MPTYNVLAAVVDLIDAETESEAKDIFKHRLENAGFDLYDDQPIDAFESEDLEPAGGVITFKPGEVWLDPETGEFSRNEPEENR